jgi:hypothetical protein
MRIISAIIILIITLFFVSTAHANCYWEVSSRIEGYQPAVGPFPTQTWPAQNMEVRVQSRWSTGGWWNQPNWPATRTDSTGEFDVRSALAFADPDCQTNRDFRVQIRAYSTGNQWRTVHQQQVSGPNGMYGIYNPAPVHSNRIGDALVFGDSVEIGVIRVEGLTPPPVELVPGRTDEEENEPDLTPHIEETDPNLPGQPGHGDDTPQAAEYPCGMRHSRFAGGVELRFGQLSTSQPALSSDQALRTELRSNTQGVTLNRLRHHILVENAGSRNYVHDSRCPALVQFRFNEGPGHRGAGDAAWSAPVFSDIASVVSNATVAVDRQSNLLGAGDVLQGQWNSQWSDGSENDDFYRFVLIEVVLDPTNVVQETAEGDNEITHCYDAPQNAFVAMSNCQSKGQ